MSSRLPAPPRFIERVLVWMLPDDVVGRSILGDMAEEFRARAESDLQEARRWYGREALGVVTRRTLHAAVPGDPG